MRLRPLEVTGFCLPLPAPGRAAGFGRYDPAIWLDGDEICKVQVLARC